MSTTAPPTKPGLRPKFGRRQAKPQYPVQIRPDGSRDVELPLRAHLVELRNRLIKAAAAVVITTAISIFFMNDEAKLLLQIATTTGHKVISTETTGTFVAYLKMAFYTGIAMSMPIIIYQL